MNKSKRLTKKEIEWERRRSYFVDDKGRKWVFQPFDIGWGCYIFFPGNTFNFNLRTDDKIESDLSRENIVAIRPLEEMKPKMKMVLR